MPVDSTPVKKIGKKLTRHEVYEIIRRLRPELKPSDEMLDVFEGGLKYVEEGEMIINQFEVNQFHLLILARGEIYCGVSTAQGQENVLFGDVHIDPVGEIPVLFIPFELTYAPFSIKAGPNCVIMLTSIEKEVTPWLEDASKVVVMENVAAELALGLTALFPIDKQISEKPLSALNDCMQPVIKKDPKIESRLVYGSELVNQLFGFQTKPGRKCLEVMRLMSIEMARYPSIERDIFKGVAISCAKAILDPNKTLPRRQNNLDYLYIVIEMLSNQWMATNKK